MHSLLNNLRDDEPMMKLGAACPTFCSLSPNCEGAGGFYSFAKMSFKVHFSLDMTMCSLPKVRLWAPCSSLNKVDGGRPTL